MKRSWWASFKVDGQCAWQVEGDTESEARGQALSLFQSHPTWSKQHPIPEVTLTEMLDPNELEGGTRDWYYGPADSVAETIRADFHSVDHVDGPMTVRSQQTQEGVTFEMSGRPPQQEDGSGAVCIRLAQALSRASADLWTAESETTGRESGIDGFVVAPNGQRVGVQVTRVGQQRRWASVGQTGAAVGSTTPSDAADNIWEAIHRKLTVQDPKVILALHAGEPPYYGFPEVIQLFERRHGATLRTKVVFAQVWLIGYTEATTARLHPLGR
jgi:hypothetical protein